MANTKKIEEISPVKGPEISDFVKEQRTITVKGNEYPVREMSLSEKLVVLEPLFGVIREALTNVIVKNEDDSFHIEFPKDMTLADLNADQLLFSSMEKMTEIMKKSVPDFLDWETLPESEARGPMNTVLEVNDFKGCFLNFFALAKTVTRWGGR